MTMDQSENDLPSQRAARERNPRQRQRTEASPAAAASPAPPAHPNKWWQWVLVYPGIMVALLGSVPTIYQAYTSWRLGVPYGQTYDALEQNRLWVENFACAKTVEFTSIVTPHKVEIGSYVCQSGDVLLRAKRPEWNREQFRWVAWSSVAAMTENEPMKNALSSLISSAQAQEFSPIRPSQNPPRVICQRWVGNGLLLQRVAMQNGCVDQVVNTFNGWVVSSHPAPCVPSC